MSLRVHLERAAKIGVWLGHPDNTKAGIRGPRAHDLEYVLALPGADLKPDYRWLRATIEGNVNEDG